VFLSTSLFTTILFVLIGYIVQTHSAHTTSVMLEEELRSSFRAYESLWSSRAEFLSSVSRLMSGMPDVRAAFSTGDGATIRDSAGELWSRISRSDAVFLVTDPTGLIIASLSNSVPVSRTRIDSVAAVASAFPSQSSGFSFLGNRLHQVVITPVYVDSGRGPALINVLVAGFAVDDRLVQALKESTDGSESLIVANGSVIASTLAPAAAQTLAAAKLSPGDLQQVRTGEETWSILATSLDDVTGRPIGELRILRPFTSASRRIADLRFEIAAIWAAAILFALLITFFVASRLLGPIKLLDTAAREVGRGNYDHRVPLDGDDEMGRLGRTFNAMSASIRNSRDELIRQERINTLGRIASSVVHDLRNPLAAIYSGAELLVDSEGLPAPYTKRLAANIYRASRQVLSQLDDLLALTRGNAPPHEICRVSEVIEDAWSSVTAQAEAVSVRLAVEGETALETSVSRARFERVFVNLFANAIQAMPRGGQITVRIDRENGAGIIRVADTGPGVPKQIRESLFQPFTTAGKSNGLGLGLALSRQTVLEHGGDLTLEASAAGACFRIRLPLPQAPVPLEPSRQEENSRR
jgi:signal transduction histidine kinase